MLETTEAAPPCAVCSDPVDPETAHWCHRAGCPLPGLSNGDHVPGAAEVRTALDRCDCDELVHPDCCRECREEES